MSLRDSKQSPANVTAAMKAALGATTNKNTSSSSSSSSRVMALAALSAAEEAALTGHFRDVTQQALATISDRRRHEILSYYYGELQRAGHLSSNVEDAAVVIPTATPNETVTNAIASRIHYFSQLEQTLKESMAAAAENNRRSARYAWLAIAGFFVMLFGGGYVLLGTDNGFSQFIGELSAGTYKTNREARRKASMERKAALKLREREESAATAEHVGATGIDDGLPSSSFGGEL